MDSYWIIVGGQSFDNVANMSGQHNGVQALLKERNKVANYVPWAAQSLNLATIVDFYARLKEVTETIGSHHDKLLGRPGKTILLDEIFFTKRKYNKGRKTKTMTQVVLGISCRDDKEGLFLVDREKKKDLWPLHCNPETSEISLSGGDDDDEVPFVDDEDGNPNWEEY
ncbi:DDE_Tnp_IS1595 domain-containing protein [Trichonephila clavipes]|nr:DDE_Tnp_IS1595 domain-containing protein [Trichonephila clavipes]